MWSLWFSLQWILEDVKNIPGLNRQSGCLMWAVPSDCSLQLFHLTVPSAVHRCYFFKVLTKGLILRLCVSCSSSSSSQQRLSASQTDTCGFCLRGSLNSLALLVHLSRDLFGFKKLQITRKPSTFMKYRALFYLAVYLLSPCCITETCCRLPFAIFFRYSRFFLQLLWSISTPNLWMINKGN